MRPADADQADCGQVARIEAGLRQAEAGEFASKEEIVAAYARLAATAGEGAASSRSSGPWKGQGASS